MPRRSRPGRFPVFLLESRHGVHYGFPPHGGAGVKIAKHHHADETVDPDTVDRAISATDEALIRAALADHIPAANGRMIAAKTCLYTVTPDHDFIIDPLPGAANVIVASPCSGHGFKFAPVIGEILGDLATDGATRHDISRFQARTLWRLARELLAQDRAQHVGIVVGPGRHVAGAARSCFQPERCGRSPSVGHRLRQHHHLGVGAVVLEEVVGLVVLP